MVPAAPWSYLYITFKYISLFGLKEKVQNCTGIKVCEQQNVRLKGPYQTHYPPVHASVQDTSKAAHIKTPICHVPAHPTASVSGLHYFTAATNRPNNRHLPKLMRCLSDDKWGSSLSLPSARPRDSHISLLCKIYQILCRRGGLMGPCIMLMGRGGWPFPLSVCRVAGFCYRLSLLAGMPDNRVIVFRPSLFIVFIVWDLSLTLSPFLPPSLGRWLSLHCSWQSQWTGGSGRVCVLCCSLVRLSSAEWAQRPSTKPGSVLPIQLTGSCVLADVQGFGGRDRGRTRRERGEEGHLGGRVKITAITKQLQQLQNHHGNYNTITIVTTQLCQLQHNRSNNNPIIAVIT